MQQIANSPCVVSLHEASVAVRPALLVPVATNRTPECRSRIDPVTLRLFAAVVDTGKIAAVAEREFIAPSAVSKRLSDLEESLGTKLLQRSNRGIELTDAGTELLGLARRVLNDLDNIYFQMRDYSSGVRGLVRVYANSSSIIRFMPSVLYSFMEKYPQIQIQLQEKISSAVLHGIASNVADVGLYAHDASSHAEGVISLRYRNDELALVAPIAHPLARRSEVSIAEAFGHEFVGLHTGSAVQEQLVRAARELNVTFKYRVQATSFDALSLMVEAGLGISLMPRAIAERYSKIAGIRTILLTEPWAHRELRICVRSLPGLSVAARLFVEHLQFEAAA